METPSLTRAQKNRLIILHRDRVWARNMQEREITLFDGLVALGLATREEADNGHVGQPDFVMWYRYRPTPAGDELAKTFAQEDVGAYRHELTFQGPPSTMTVDELRRNHRFMLALHESKGPDVCNGRTIVGAKRVRGCQGAPVLVDALGDGWCGTHLGFAVVCARCGAHIADDRCVCE
jgi:hypothetical protein